MKPAVVMGTEILLYESIGGDDDYGTSDLAFAEAMNRLETEGATEITVRINSYGGEVKASMGIRAAMRGAKARGVAVPTVCDGVAASAAADLLAEGSTITICEGGLVMIHESAGFAWGMAADLEAEATVLRKYNAAMLPAWHRIYKGAIPFTERFYNGRDNWLDVAECQALFAVNAAAHTAATPVTKDMAQRQYERVVRQRYEAARTTPKPLRMTTETTTPATTGATTPTPQATASVPPVTVPVTPPVTAPVRTTEERLSDLEAVHAQALATERARVTQLEADLAAARTAQATAQTEAQKAQTEANANAAYVPAPYAAPVPPSDAIQFTAEQVQMYREAGGQGMPRPMKTSKRPY